MHRAKVTRWFNRIFRAPLRLTERQQRLIRISIANLLPNADQVADIFRERLILLDRRLGPLLGDGLDSREWPVAAAMRAVVEHLHGLRRLAPALQEMGRHYDSRGMTNVDYEKIRTALISTLDRQLGADFTAETREAWTICFIILTDQMKRGASMRNIPLLPPC